MLAASHEIMYKVEKKNWWFKVRSQLLQQLIKQFVLNKNEQLKILDIGCGTGLNSLNVRQFGEVVSLDISPAALNFCKQNGLENVHLGEAGKLPFESRTFDLVFALDVLEHVKDDQEAVREIQRVLKQGGIFIGFVPAFSFLWSKHDEYLMHFRRYHRGSFTALFANDWQHLKVSYFNTILFPVVALIRLISELLKIPYKDPLEKHSPFNGLLYRIFALELYFLRFFNFSFGVSLLGVFRKK